MTMSELEVMRRCTRFIVTSLILIGIALLLTFTAMRIRSLWLMIIAFSILFASFCLLFSGIVMRAEYKAMKELRK